MDEFQKLDQNISQEELENKILEAKSNYSPEALESNFFDDFSSYKVVEDPKWDIEGELDIKSGVLSYDAMMTGNNQRNAITEKDQANDPILNHLADIILNESIENNFNDFQIGQNKNFGFVRVKQGGGWLINRFIYKSVVDPLIKVFKNRAKMQIGGENQTRHDENGQFEFNSNYGGISFRLAYVYSMHGSTLELRTLPNDNIVNDLSVLDLPDYAIELIRASFRSRGGLIVFAGPMGSGKSYITAVSLKDLIRTTGGSKNIVTIENPIERPIAGVNQLEIDISSNNTYQGLIQNARRSAVQVLQVGEINSPESAKGVVEIANAGAVVVTTIHARSSLEIFEALASQEVNLHDVQNAGRLFIFLSRVPKLNSELKVPHTLEPHQFIWLKENLTMGNKEPGFNSVSSVPENLTPEQLEEESKKHVNPEEYGYDGEVTLIETLVINSDFLRMFRKYGVVDIYELKKHLMNPTSEDKTDFPNINYHPLEADILTKLGNKEIDMKTARGLVERA